MRLRATAIVLVWERDPGFGVEHRVALRVLRPHDEQERLTAVAVPEIVPAAVHSEPILAHLGQDDDRVERRVFTFIQRPDRSLQTWSG